MDSTELRHWSARAAAWGLACREGLSDHTVRAQTLPGAIAAQIAPEQGHGMEAIREDFTAIIPSGMSPWQNPRFFACFPANAAPVSVVAEYLVSAVAAQCMLRQTSPAATELETCVMVWPRQALGLADGFSGVMQDSVSSATLAAVPVMRERALQWAGNRAGLSGQPLSGQPRLRVQASEQVHSSVDRALWIAGIGADNLVRIPTKGPLCGMDRAALATAIAADRAAGMLPAGMVACTVGTSIGAGEPDSRRGSGGKSRRAVPACRCRLGRFCDDLPGIPGVVAGGGCC